MLYLWIYVIDTYVGICDGGLKNKLSVYHKTRVESFNIGTDIKYMRLEWSFATHFDSVSVLKLSVCVAITWWHSVREGQVDVHCRRS